MFVSRIMLLIYFLITVNTKTLVEYRLWYNFGEIVNDFSGNGLHAVYGTSPPYPPAPPGSIPTATPIGAYFASGDTISMPPNGYVALKLNLLNPTSFIFWLLKLNSNAGTFFSRSSSTSSIKFATTSTNVITVSISGESQAITFQNTLSNSMWNLIIISLSGSNVILNINALASETYTMNSIWSEDSSQTFTTFIMDSSQGVREWYIFSFVVIDTQAVSTDYYNTQDINLCLTGTCSSATCTFAAITSMGNGCISTSFTTKDSPGNPGGPAARKSNTSPTCAGPACDKNCFNGDCLTCPASCTPKSCINSISGVSCQTLTIGCPAGYYTSSSNCIKCNSDCNNCNSTYCFECTANNSSYVNSSRVLRSSAVNFKQFLYEMQYSMFEL